MYSLGECPFRHCLLCAEHFNAPTPYCLKCLSERFEEVRKDAEIRGVLNDHKAHGLYLIGHEKNGKDDA